MQNCYVCTRIAQLRHRRKGVASGLSVTRSKINTKRSVRVRMMSVIENWEVVRSSEARNV